MKALKTLVLVSVFSLVTIGFSQSNSEKANNFNLIDNDKNEVITIGEMLSFYKDKNDKNGKPINAYKVFNGLDSNKNSIITLSEFVEEPDWSLANQSAKDANYTLTKKSKIKPRKTNRKLSVKKDTKTKNFEKIDHNGDGILKADEVVNFFKGKLNDTTGEPINGKVHFYTYDTNNDGKVTIEEYKLEPNWKKGKQRYKDSENISAVTNRNLSSDAYSKKQVKLFGKVDLNDDLKISYEELHEFYKGKTNSKGKPISVGFKFYGMDTNEDDMLDINEFTTKINLEYARRRYRERKQ